MGKKNKGSATGSATAAVSGFSDYDIVRAECEKAVRSLKNNPPRAQKLMKEACQKHPNVALGFRYYAHVEKRLAEQQHDASALKKRHVNAALEAAKRATALSPNSVEHAYFYAMLLHEYLPQQEGGKRNDEEAIAECKRALAIAEPVDPAEDMLGELPDALETAEEGVGHFKHRLRQLSHQMNLEGLQHIFKHVSVDANGNFVPLNTEPRPGMPSEQSISELISARERGKISGTEAGQTSQVRVQLGLESKEEGEQQNAYGDKRDAGEIGTSENGGTEGTWIGEVKSGGESASAKEGEEAGQVQSSVSAEPGTPRNSRKSGSATKEIAEPHEEDEDENYMTCKECDATFTSANEYLAHHNEQHPSLPPDDLIVPVELPANFNIDTMLPTDGPEAARLMLEDALRTRKATHGPAGYNCPTHGLNACPITLGNQNLNLPVVVENLARIRALRGALTTVGVAIGRRRLLMDHQHKIFQYLVDVLQNMLPDPSAMVEWQHDWHLLRMVNKEELDMVRTYLKDEVIYETTEDKGTAERTKNSGEPASSGTPDSRTATVEPGARSAAGGSTPPAGRVISAGVGGLNESEAKALSYLMHGDGSAGSVGIEALRQRNFVKEAVDDVTSCILPFGGKQAIQKALGAKGTELTKHLLGYASGTGVTALPGCPVRFRRMNEQKAGEILNAFCSERAWWLFTWDLLRSPPKHFAIMQTWLEEPENEGIGETVRCMALAALRVRAYVLEKQYRAAKARLWAGREGAGGREKRQELARLALAVAVATDEFATCINRETTEFCGQKYADALLAARAVFTDEPAPDTVPVNPIWIERVVMEAEERCAEVPEGHRGWLRTNYDILKGLKLGLQTATEELRCANLANECDEGAATPGTERRPKGGEGDPRWVVDSYFNEPVILTWVRRKLGEAGDNGFYSEKYLERVLLETEDFDAQFLLLQLKVALGENRAAVIEELCELLASALEAADGIPRQLNEAAEQAAAELLTAESKPSEKAVKTGGKKKKKKGESKETLHRLSAAEASASPQGVEPRVKTATDFGPGQEAVSEGDARLKGHGGANPVLRPPGAQMIGESKSSSGSGGKVEKRGGLTEESGQRRQEDLEPGPGIAATPAPSDRPGVGAGAGSGAAEAADVINDQQAVESWICQSHLVRYPHDACSEVGADSASASTEMGPAVIAAPTPTQAIQSPTSNPPGAPSAGASVDAPGESNPLDCGQPDAGNRSDAGKLPESHVAAGESLAGSGGGEPLGGQAWQIGTGASVPATGHVSKQSLNESEAKALNYLMHGDGSAGSVGIEALRQRNFVKEAVEDVTSCLLPFGGKDSIQRALGQKGTELTKHLLGYASGTGVMALPGCLVRFRRMTSQQAGEILNAFCSERAWWLFTWDLVRSPPEHFEAMQDLMESPEEDGLVGETITNMALAALRVRAYVLEKQYGAAKARLLAGNEAASGRDARRELARLALAAAVANEKFARCIERETVEYGGWEYIGALEYVHEAFTEEPTVDMVSMDATWIDDVMVTREARVASVPDDDAAWLRTNYNILRGLKVGLQTAIEELRFANLVNEIDEGAVGEVSKGWEGEPRWVVTSALNVPVIMTWVRRKLGETGGNSFYSERYLERALPETAKFDVQLLFLRLKVALGDKRAVVIKELCELLASALEAPDDIPRQLKEAAEQAAPELLRGESEPSEKATKKRKKKKGAPKDEPARLPPASPSSQEAEPTAETSSKSLPGREAVSKGFKRNDGEASPVSRPLAEALPTAGSKGRVARVKAGRGGTAEDDACALVTAGAPTEAREAGRGRLSKEQLREKVEAGSGAGKAEQGSGNGASRKPSDATEAAGSGSAEVALQSADTGAAGHPGRVSSGAALDPADCPPGAAKSAPCTSVTSATLAADDGAVLADEGARGPAREDGPEGQENETEGRKNGTEQRNEGMTGSDDKTVSGAVDTVDALRQRNFVRETVDDVAGRISCALGRDCTANPGDDSTGRFLEYLSDSGVADLPGRPGGFFREALRWDAHEYLLSTCHERVWWQFTLDLLRSPSEHFFQNYIVRWLGKEENDDVGETIRGMAVAALKMREHALRLQYRAVEERLNRPMEPINGCDDPLGGEEKLRSALERLATGIGLTQAAFVKCMYCEALIFQGRKYVDVLPMAYECFAKPPESQSFRKNLETIEHAKGLIDIALPQREKTLARKARKSEEHREWVERHFDLLENQLAGIKTSLHELKRAKAAVKAEDEPGARAAKPRGLLTSSLNVPVIMTWVERKVADAGLNSGAVKRVEAVLLDTRECDSDELNLALKAALGEKGAPLALNLWIMLNSARGEPDGIPWQIKEAAEVAAAELLSAEPGPDAKGTKKGKKKKKGQSTDKPERSPAAAKDVPTGKVDDVGLPHQLALVTSASPNDGAGSPPVREAGDSKAAAQVTGESDLSSRSGAGVEKRGGRNQPSGERRPKGSEQGPGSAGSRATSDRPSVGAGARRGAAEAADVINDQLEIVAGSASASTDTGLCDFRPSTPTPPVQLPSSTPPGFPTAGAFIVAPGETKPITPGCRQPDAGNRSDARAHSKSHVAAGERPAASSGGGNFGGTGASVPATESVTAASGRQQPPPKLYRPVLSVAGVSTASQGVSPGADVRRDGTGSPLPVAPLTGKVQGAPTPRGIQRAESGAPGIQTVRTEPAKRERNRKGKRSVGPPEVMMPTVDASNDGATPIPRAAAGSLSPGSGHAKLKPNPNSNPNLNPQHSPVTSQPPRRPRAPYNPLARAKPLAPAGPTGQSTFSKATSLPIISPQRKVLAAGDQRAASSFEPSTSGVDMTSAEASADVTPNVPIGPVAQRSPESSSFSPELPSILAMLLPVEGASVNVAPPTSTAPSNVYRSDADRPIPGGVSVASGHLANIDWAGATEMGPSSWGKSPSVQSKSRKASGRKVTKKMATSGGTEKQDRRGNGVCSICFDNPKNGAIIPCGHCLCYECGSMMKERRGECPFCNRKIESVFKIFL